MERGSPSGRLELTTMPHWPPCLPVSPLNRATSWFLLPKCELTPRELTFVTDIDHLNHEAIAAVDQRDNSMVGVARYVRDADRPEVADPVQRMGSGPLSPALRSTARSPTA